MATFAMAGARALAVTVLLAGLLAGCAGGAAGVGIGTATGFNVVDYEAGDRPVAPLLEGESLRPGARIAAEPGSVVVVNFWGSWCGPCRREQPMLEALWKEYEDRGVRFVGVNTRRDLRPNAIAFLDEFSVTYPSIYDPDSRVAHRFGIRFLPATQVVDRQGRIAARIIGALRTEQDLRVILERELEP